MKKEIYIKTEDYTDIAVQQWFELMLATIEWKRQNSKSKLKKHE